MYSSEIFIRVRYAETDQMGYVYYGNYLTYYEVARVEALRKLGISYKSIEESGVIMPVLENYSKFIAPAKYDDYLKIVTTVNELPNIIFKFNYQIFNEEDTLLNIGNTALVFVNKETGKPCKIPEFVSNRIKDFFNAG